MKSTLVPSKPLSQGSLPRPAPPGKFAAFPRLTAGLLSVAVLLVAAIIVFMVVVEPRRTLVDVRLANQTVNKIRVGPFQQRLTWERRLNLGEQKAANAKRPYIDQLIIDDRPLGTLAFAGGVLRQMAREILVQEEATRRGITVSEEEVQLYIEQTYGLLSVPVLSPNNNNNKADLSADGKKDAIHPPAVPATPIPPQTREQRREAAEARFKSNGLPQEYREVVRAELTEKKVRAAFAADIPSQEDRVRFHLIRFETEESARETARALEQGGGFDALYTRVQAGQIGNAAGTEVDWTSKRELQRDFNAAFANALFETDVGEALKSPLGAAKGWYLSKVEGHEMRTLSEEWRKQRGIDAYQSWLEQQQPRVTEYALWMKRVPPLEGVRAVTDPFSAAGLLPTGPGGTTPNKNTFPTPGNKSAPGLGRDRHSSSHGNTNKGYEIPGTSSHARPDRSLGGEGPGQSLTPARPQGGNLPGAGSHPSARPGGE